MNKKKDSKFQSDRKHIKSKRYDFIEEEYDEIDRHSGSKINSKEKEYIDKRKRKEIEKPLKMFAIACVVITIMAFVFMDTSTVDDSKSATDALKNKVSTSILAGTVLLLNDESTEPKDYTITHNSEAKETKVWVWDYAAEDGDYVQILVNDSPIGDAFMIKHKPREFNIPLVGKVQIKGIRDGGGGITYAVRYDINGTSYFNIAPEGKFNTYTLTK